MMKDGLAGVALWAGGVGLVAGILLGNAMGPVAPKTSASQLVVPVACNERGPTGEYMLQRVEPCEDPKRCMPNVTLMIRNHNRILSALCGR